MRELNSGKIKITNDGNIIMQFSNYHHVIDSDTELYYKHQADKVIAEKDKKIAELKEGAKNLILDNYLKDKEIRRHKHKRCLAMARWCRIHDEFTLLESERLGLPQRAIFMEYRRKAMWWNKWHKRWLELAEKFNEVK